MKLLLLTIHPAKRYCMAGMLSLLMLFNACHKDEPCVTCPPPNGDCNLAVCKLVDNAGNPDWSPTGERFAFLRIADSMLCLYYFSDKHIEPLVNGEEPNFSPDGKKLAYEWHRGIYILDIDTKTTKKIARGITPNWSENGQWIAFGHYTAFKRRSTGELIPGLPNPDSSIYMYDVLADTMGRIIINHLNPPTGAEVGIAYPTWILKDTYLAFATEPQVAAVPRQGGNWIHLTNLPAPSAKQTQANAMRLLKKADDSDLLGAGQMSWNRKVRALDYYLGTAMFPTGIQKNIVRLLYVSGIWGESNAGGDWSDPAWAPDSVRSLYVSGNAVYKMDVTKPAHITS